MQMPLLGVQFYIALLRAEQYVVNFLSPAWNCLQYAICCRRSGAYGQLKPEHPDDPECAIMYRVSPAEAIQVFDYVAHGPNLVMLTYHMDDPIRKCCRIFYGSDEVQEAMEQPRCKGRDLASLPFFECEVEYVDGSKESIYEDLLMMRVKGNVIKPAIARVGAKRTGVGIQAVLLHYMDFNTGDMRVERLGQEGVTL